jgi:hypothetical protein
MIVRIKYKDGRDISYSCDNKKDCFKFAEEEKEEGVVFYKIFDNDGKLIFSSGENNGR